MGTEEKRLGTEWKGYDRLCFASASFNFYDTTDLNLLFRRNDPIQVKFWFCQYEDIAHF